MSFVIPKATIHFRLPDSDPHLQQQNSPSLPGRCPLFTSPPESASGPPRSGGHSNPGDKRGSSEGDQNCRGSMGENLVCKAAR